MHQVLAIEQGISELSFHLPSSYISYKYLGLKIDIIVLYMYNIYNLAEAPPHGHSSLDSHYINAKKRSIVNALPLAIGPRPLYSIWLQA